MILCRIFAIALAGWTVSALANAGELVSHRAVYDMELLEASERSGITGVDGRMVYEFLGNDCKGYAVRFRSVASFRSEAGRQLIDQRVTTFEDTAKSNFSFATQSFTDNKLEKEVKGEAQHGAADGLLKVALSLPDRKNLELSDALFPVEHMKDLLARAKAGERIYAASVFDGTEDGDKVLLTNIVIGEPLQANEESISQTLGELAEGSYWPVSMSYYDVASPSDGEDEPVFRLSFDLYDNGVTRDFRMDYGEFIVRQKLVELEPLKAPSCEAE
ncbi:cell envelope integrity EipB family protein [Notoacmeibacter sp. MSK16QG-6]|uniref:cell envelope integrity EipB family protein n=1 Tax=Notoacmeibacter sp. MSK16QG-6 TaxID=2957982 RepID=UPI00209D7F2C|nr:cell envelope integrity EipB family protein [Notoacmeibacter sp. MSK16QG-6]MCP1199307.1 cell envelope integrity EipB family protein [Notoacmeibacter sp. MSK16QG-6]